MSNFLMYISPYTFLTTMIWTMFYQIAYNDDILHYIQSYVRH